MNGRYFLRVRAVSPPSLLFPLLSLPQPSSQVFAIPSPLLPTSSRGQAWVGKRQHRQKLIGSMDSGQVHSQTFTGSRSHTVSNISHCTCTLGGCASSCQSCLTLELYGLQPSRLLRPRNFPGKNTGVGCHALLQGIFLAQESNPHLLHCRQILYH